jgi:hypothetical protein
MQTSRFRVISACVVEASLTLTHLLMFDTAFFRHNFPAMQAVLSHLVRALKKVPSSQALDMDNILTRESLDVIGLSPSFQQLSHAFSCLSPTSCIDIVVDRSRIVLL